MENGNNKNAPIQMGPEVQQEHNEAKARSLMCAREIEAVLAKNNCFIDFEVTLSKAGIRPTFHVRAKSAILVPTGVITGEPSADH